MLKAAPSGAAFRVSAASFFCGQGAVFGRAASGLLVERRPTTYL
jgi:hypothetical protein